MLDIVQVSFEDTWIKENKICLTHIGDSLSNILTLKKPEAPSYIVVVLDAEMGLHTNDDAATGCIMTGLEFCHIKAASQAVPGSCDGCISFKAPCKQVASKPPSCTSSTLASHHQVLVWSWSYKIILNERFFFIKKSCRNLLLQGQKIKFHHTETINNSLSLCTILFKSEVIWSKYTLTESYLWRLRNMGTDRLLNDRSKSQISDLRSDCQNSIA